MINIELFFDYACPYCYRGHKNLLNLLEYYPRIEITWRPCESHPYPETYFMHSDRAIQGLSLIHIFFGLDELSESEGMDRGHMRIPQNQINLLGALSQVNINVVGILSAGAAIEMPWHTCCKAILHGYLNGQAGAGAILDILKMCIRDRY